MKYRDRAQLTPCEIEALELQKQGLTYKQIADKLHISLGTVRTRMKSARQRIKAKERTA